MIDENKLLNYFIKDRDNYLYSVFSGLLSGFILGFAFILSIGFFNFQEPYIHYLASALILSLFFFLINNLKYHHFFQYSISSYLFYKKKFRFSLFFYRLLGIWIFNLLGLYIFLLLFYYTGLWKVGNSIGSLASRIGVYSLKFFTIDYLKLFINSILIGIIGGFVFYSVFEQKNSIKFIGFFVFSVLILTGSFRYNLYDFFNLMFTFLIKKQFIALGLKKYEMLNFYDFFFKFLNVFSGNFIGAIFVFIPIQVLIDKFRNTDRT